jgi:spore germination cell wall hydrolase CwlJ-like protein
MNRIRSPLYPKTICGVVYQGQLNRNGCQFSFACDGIPDRADNKQQWATSVSVAKKVLAREVWLDDVGYATHYHADYVKPEWRSLFNRVTKIGVHIFYIAPPNATLMALNLEG